MAETPETYDIVAAFEELGGYATRTEIATHLGVGANDVGEEGSLTAGPLGEAIAAGHIVEDDRDKAYWRLTQDGQAYLDSGLFRS